MIFSTPTSDSTWDNLPDPQFVQEIYNLRPWYHDFRRLGLKTDFPALPWRPGAWLRGGAAIVRSALRRLNDPAASGEKTERISRPRTLQPHRLNQPYKEAYLIPYLHQALEVLPPDPLCLELFCADGYYSCLMARMKPRAVVQGVDRSLPDLERARTAAKTLGFSRVTFHADDVFHFLQSVETPFDLVLCAGGLYHLARPFDLLDELRRVTRGFLVIQSAVTLETEAADYFISPAPGWKHGSRFTHAGLRQGLEKAGWRILNQARNELPGNRRRCDRGSSYYLCRVTSPPDPRPAVTAGVAV